ncbi:hypothetical protein PU560_07330, partial [Georgenia sp. 10Sc9-8]|nr:hypothetical protein [Georgenia halotolerans]
YEDTPFSPDEPIDILHLPQPPTARLLRATGGTTDEQRKATGGPFLEPAPFTGTGYAETDGVVVSLSWLEHTRLSPGARLWRFYPDSNEPELVGTYHGPAFGWQNHLAEDALHAVAPTSFVGPAARTEHGVYAAEVTTDDDGVPTAVTLVARSAKAEEHGFTRTPAGTWAKKVPVEQVQALFELHLSAVWNGMPVRVVEQFPGPEQQRLSRVFAVGLNAEAATKLKMTRIEPGVYEANVPTENLKKVTPTQRVAKTWPKPEGATPVGATAGRAAGEGQQDPGTAGQAGAADAGAPTQPTGDERLVEGDPALSGEEHQELYRRIARGVAAGAPEGAASIQMLARVVGSRVELAAQASLKDGSAAPLKGAAKDTPEAVLELRRLTYRPERGAWYTMTAMLDAQGKFTARFSWDQEPAWQQQAPSPEEYAADLAEYPREGVLPDWLAERVGEAGPGGAPSAGGS